MVVGFMAIMSAVTDQITAFYANPMNVAALAESKRQFIEALRERGIVIDACRQLNMHRNTAYIWRNTDPEFRLAWDTALEEATDVIEGSLFDNARKGNVIAQIFYLKNNRYKYRDKQPIDYQATQREMEERMEEMRQSASLQSPSSPASTKDIIAEVLGIPKRLPAPVSEPIPVEVVMASSKKQPEPVDKPDNDQQ